MGNEQILAIERTRIPRAAELNGAPACRKRTTAASFREVRRARMPMLVLTGYRLVASMVKCTYLLTIATSIEARKPLSGGARPAAAFASAASYIFSFFSLFSRRLCFAVPMCSASAFSFT